MDLKSGYPYWAVKNGLTYAFPQLDADLSCDVAVVGAGITGALIADELAGHGHAMSSCSISDIPVRRDRMVDRKAATLQRKVDRLFGRHPQYGPRVLFALAYGGNGITYSMLGAGLLRAQIERSPHPLTGLFSFARL